MRQSFSDYRRRRLWHVVPGHPGDATDSYSKLGLDSAAACFAEDGLWHLPGTAPISGNHRGWAAIREVVAAVLRLSDGTFRAELVDVAVGEQYIVAVQHATARRLGRVLDVTACQLIRMSGGVIAEIRGHYSDEVALSSFWQ